MRKGDWISFQDIYFKAEILVLESAGLTKVTYIDVGQNSLQFSVHVSDTSVAEKTEIRN